MARLGWSFIKDENKLWIKIFTSKYFSKVSFMNYSHKNGDSPLWSYILKGREVLKNGLTHIIEKGNDISLWFQKWVGEEELIKCVVQRISECLEHWRVSKSLEMEIGGWMIFILISRKI